MAGSKRSRNPKKSKGPTQAVRDDSWIIPDPNERRPEIDTSKPTSIFKPTGDGVLSTLTIALPASILNLAQTFELKAQLAGRIARAAAVFCIDEIVIFEDGEEVDDDINFGIQVDSETDSSDTQSGTDATDILFQILQYLECPPYLRRRMFPSHPYLRTAGALPSLDMPHHLRRDEWCQYREGITLDSEDPGSRTQVSGNSTNGHSHKRKRDSNGNDHSNNVASDSGSKLSPSKKQKSDSTSGLEESTHGNLSQKPDSTQILSVEANVPLSTNFNTDVAKLPSAEQVTYTSLVDCGFPFAIAVSTHTHLPLNTRVTLLFPSPKPPPNFRFLEAARWYGPEAAEPEFHAQVVDTNDPKEKDGYYWGYEVRVAANLTSVFAGCPYEGGYDLSIGTSERGKTISELNPLTRSAASSDDASTMKADMLGETFQHAIIVFGGAAGLESAAEYDTELLERVGGDKRNVERVFDFFVNAVPGQGSRTIRTEEAVWIVLGQLHGWIRSARR